MKVWETWELADRVSPWVRQQGVKRGDRVIVALSSEIRLAGVLLELMRLECSIVLVDAKRSDASLERLRVRLQSDAIVAWETQEAAWLGEYRESASILGGSLQGEVDMRSLTGWRARADALICLTSGSSGPQRAVARSGDCILQNLEATHSRMGYEGDDVFLPMVPLTHQYGFSLMVLSWLSGARLHFPQAANPIEALMRAELIDQITVVDGIPSQYRLLLRASERNPSIGRNVRLWCTGGAPCSNTLKNAVLERWGVPLLDGYGLSEVGNVALATPECTRGVGVPLEGVSVVISDVDWGDRVGTSGMGKISVSSAFGVGTYIDEEPPHNSDGIIDTGDFGYWDKSGCLHVVGRSGAVHRNGVTIHIDGIEAMLREEGVEAVVLAESREGHEPRITLWAQKADEEKVSRILDDNLPHEMRPNRVVIVPSFPCLENGKLDRFRLSTGQT